MAEIVLKFRGEEYRVPEARAFELGGEVEEVVTLAEISSWGSAPKFFKIARAFGVMLRFAGCRVSDTEVKAEIDASIARAIGTDVTPEAGAEMFAVMAVQQLQAVLFSGAPPGDGTEAAPEKPTAS